MRACGTWLPLALGLAMACKAGDRVTDSGGPADVVQCAQDDDCRWADDCCESCDVLSGRDPGDRLTTRSDAEWTKRKCWVTHHEGRGCPDVRCAPPPPCALPLDPVCREGRCEIQPRVTEAGGRYKPHRSTDECDASACGPPPTFGDPTCDGFAKAAFERCACLASDRRDCNVERWPTLCELRVRCAGADSAPGIVNALADCE